VRVTERETLAVVDVVREGETETVTEIDAPPLVIWEGVGGGDNVGGLDGAPVDDAGIDGICVTDPDTDVDPRELADCVALTASDAVKRAV